MYWYQQKPGSPPCYLLYYYSESDKHHGSGITSCFPGPMDTSANAGLLLILGLQPEDEADYYCKIWYSGLVTVAHTDGEVGQICFSSKIAGL